MIVASHERWALPWLHIYFLSLLPQTKHWQLAHYHSVYCCWTGPWACAGAVEVRVHVVVVCHRNWTAFLSLVIFQVFESGFMPMIEIQVRQNIYLQDHQPEVHSQYDIWHGKLGKLLISVSCDSSCNIVFKHGWYEVCLREDKQAARLAMLHISTFTNHIVEAINCHCVVHSSFFGKIIYYCVRISIITYATMLRKWPYAWFYFISFEGHSERCPDSISKNDQKPLWRIGAPSAEWQRYAFIGNW